MKILFNSIALVVLATIVQAEFSDSFRNYFAGQPELLKVLSRNDLFGAIGSFGGGRHVGGTQTRRVPLIIVHGGGLSAQQYIKYKDEFIKRGYSAETVYATSWGIPAHTYEPNLEMTCEYVKQIRKLIIAVSKFTNNRVNIVAYGTGSPIARKAVIGGNCVDTNEDLGVPLTASVRAFVSVRDHSSSNSNSKFIFSGQNGGILCDPSGDKRATCLNMDIGLNCGSKFIRDINAIDKRVALFHIDSIVPLLLQKTSCGSDPYTIPYSKVYEYDFNGVEQNVNRVVEILKNDDRLIFIFLPNKYSA